MAIRRWLSFLGALAIGAAGLSVQAPVVASQPGINGHLLVVGERDGEFGAYLVDPVNAAATRLPVAVESPQGIDWSPDGKQIVMALTEEPDGTTTNLWTMNADGSDIRVLVAADEGVHLVHPTWSPEGDVIAFIRWDRPVMTLETVDVAGGAVTALGEITEPGDPMALGWSPRGDLLVIELFGDLTTAILTLELATLELRSLAIGSEPDWSPNGQSIVFLSRDDEGVPGATTTMAFDGSGQTPLAELIDAGLQGFHPAWSPDGGRIAFTPLVPLGAIGILNPGGQLTFLEAGFDFIADIAWQPLPTPSGFVDVPAEHTFSTDIAWLSDAGLTAGCDPPGALHFCPGRRITRGEAVAILVRALGLRVPAEGDRFVDDDDSIFEKDFDAAAAGEIVLGCNPPANDRACPNAWITRAEAAAVFARALRLPPPAADHFEDDDGSIFASDIDRIADAGITRGCDPPANRHFCPNATMTRAEYAAFVHRAFG